MKLSEFDYHLPKELIAQYSLTKRDEARLMVVDKEKKSIEHRKFRDIIKYLKPQDVLVVNESKVIPARLFGRRLTGGRVEVLLLNLPVNGISEVLTKSSGKLKDKEKIIFQNGRLEAKLLFTDTKFKQIKFLEENNQKLMKLINQIGHIPLPPYIKRKVQDSDRRNYQTVYAKNEGSVASPTAGLHFTKELMDEVKQKEVKIAKVILHINYATFNPVKKKNIEEHKMYKEYYEFPKNAAEIITEAKRKNRRIIAVGTTSCRVLETVAKKAFSQSAERKAQSDLKGWTDLFIYPPYEFKLTDGLITNFHFPKSTLLMLVSAFASKKFIMRAYQEAIHRKYRFYSYGDAMFII